MSTHSLLTHARHSAVLHGATRSPLVARARAVLRMLCVFGGVAGLCWGLPVSLMHSRRRTLRQTWVRSPSAGWTMLWLATSPPHCRCAWK